MKQQWTIPAWLVIMLVGWWPYVAGLDLPTNIKLNSFSAWYAAAYTLIAILLAIGYVLTKDKAKTLDQKTILMRRQQTHLALFWILYPLTMLVLVSFLRYSIGSSGGLGMEPLGMALVVVPLSIWVIASIIAIVKSKSQGLLRVTIYNVLMIVIYSL